MCIDPSTELTRQACLRQHAEAFKREHQAVLDTSDTLPGVQHLLNREAPIAPNWVMGCDAEGNAIAKPIELDGDDNDVQQGGALEDLAWLAGGFLGCVLLAVIYLAAKGMPFKAIAELLWRAQ